MALSNIDRRLIAAAAEGLSVVPRPYAALGHLVGLDEVEVIDHLRHLLADGTIKRLGVVVRHHELGYQANAMVVWDVPDDAAARIGTALSALPFVTLCYRRPRRPPLWPYNLFSVIHGRDRGTVMAQIEHAKGTVGLADIGYDVLFSRRRFKQHGARYCAPPGGEG